MKYVCTLLVVKDIEKSKKFYKDILDQDVISDLGANATLSGGFALQTADSFEKFIHKEKSEIIYENNAVELYFEEDNMDTFVEKLKSYDIKYVHPLKKHSWGQSVIRFYDLDNHIIEVGENMEVVVKRFIDNGLTVGETAVKMDVPVEYVKSMLK